VRNQKQRHSHPMTWLSFAGGALFLAYAVGRSLKRRRRAAQDSALGLSGHTLVPLLQNINQAARELADGLNELKPKEKPKGRISRLYDWLGTAWSKTIKAITATLILAFLLGGLFQQFRGRNDVILERFKVPSDLEKVGYSPEVVATKLADNIKAISDNAVSHVGSNIGASATTSLGGSKGGVTTNKSLISLQTFALASEKSPLDIEVPETRVTVKSIFLYIFESLGVTPRRIDGEITSRGNVLTLIIRITEGGATRSLPVIEDSTGSTEALLSEGARAIYRDIQPVVLASYLYSSSPADTPAAKELIQDCIYQDREAALANVLWGIILLNESKFDEALRKFEDAKKYKHDSQIDDILVSCRARALEAKGGDESYKAAEKTYKDALNRSWSLLTLTNYAGYLADRGFAEDALEKYDQVLIADPGSDIAHNGKGFALELLGRYDDAVKEHEEAIKLNPKSSSGYASLAVALVGMKRYDEAVAAARKAVQVEPMSASAYSTLGYVLQSTGKYGEAIKEFERAVEHNPLQTYAYINWADALLNLRNYEEATAKTQRALEIDSNSVAAHSEMALILLNKKDFNGAIKECEQVVNRDSRFVPAYDNWVTALSGLKRYELAEAKAREIVRIAPDSADAHNILGYVLKSRGNYGEAVKEFEHAATLNASNTYIYVNWAETLINQKQLEGAAAKARYAIGLDEVSADAHNMLGYVLRYQGEYDGALNEHERAIQVNQQNVYGYLGWAEAMLDKAENYEEAERKKMYDAAEQKIRVAVEKDPFSVDARNLLGRVLRKKKQYAEAIAKHEEAAALDPNDVYAYTGLAETYMALADEGSARKANIEKALAATRKAVGIDPTSADTHGELGWALIAQGDFDKDKGADDKAKGEYEEALKEFVEANRLNPSDPYPYVGLSKALREKGECGEAEKQARDALKLAPKLGDACGELNKALDCLGQPPAPCG
jgi:tetratricopeptide (TPR) repeat protein